jgi:hypothetical protein
MGTKLLVYVLTRYIYEIYNSYLLSKASQSLSKLSVLVHTCNTSLAAGDSDPDHYIQLHILEHISIRRSFHFK